MHGKIQKVLGYLENELSYEGVVSFKIGITSNLEEREEAEEYRGYHLYRIAKSDTPKLIIDAEKDLIQYFKNNLRVGKKCENEQQGGGQIDGADSQYFAIRFRPENEDVNLVFLQAYNQPVEL